MNDAVSMDQLFICLHQSVMEVRGSSNEVARRMGIRHGTLLTKLNPLDDLHLPNLSEFVRIMDATNNTLPLDILCSMFGGRFVSRSSECGESVLAATLHMVSEGGDVVKAIEESMADGVLTDAERVQLRREIMNHKRSIMALENTIDNAPGAESAD